MAIQIVRQLSPKLMVHSWGQLQHQSGGVFGVNDLVGGLVQDAGADGFDAGHGFFQIVGGQSDGRQAFASIGETMCQL